MPIAPDLLSILNKVPDPEIPVIDIVALGIVREAKWVHNTACEVTITPTYFGCPAMHVIEEDIKAAMQKHGISVVLRTQLTPVWTTDWITDEAKEKLRQYGITPPEKNDRTSLVDKPKPCPRCNSTNTKKVSQFGSTLCKASYKCNDCLEPFDYFKCL